MSNHILRNRKAITQQLYDYLNRYDFATAATMVVSRTTDNYLLHWQDVRKTFPDFKLEPLDITIQDERIVVHSLFSGTHRGVAKLAHHGSLLVGAKPTGRTVSVSQIHVYQVVVGRLLELYAVRDDESLYQQLKLFSSVDRVLEATVEEDLIFLAR
jgi:predicted ester cyclase